VTIARPLRSFRLAFALGAVSAAAFPASAVDGVAEINQTCAVQSGCFPGDAAGFPVTVAAPGRYRLTSNLTNLDSNLKTIELQANLIDIDLNGFTIGGPVSCSIFSGVFCTNTGAGDQIAGTAFGLSVHNGTLYGSPRWAIRLGASARVENVQVIGAGRTAIEVGEGSRVSNCLVAVAPQGIVAPSSLVFDSVIRDVGDNNLNQGFLAVDGNPGLAIIRNLHVYRIYASAYFRNVRSVGTSYCDANAC
jgi:hypothetical protein